MRIMGCFVSYLLYFFLSEGLYAQSVEHKPVQLKKHNSAVLLEKSNPVLISKVVGMASDQVVTSREVQIVHAISRALNNDTQLDPLKIEDPRFNLEVSQVLLDIVVQLESVVFDFNQLSESELLEAKTKVKKIFEQNKSIKNFSITDQELDRLLKRKLVSRKFIRVKSDSMKGFITDVEAKDYFDKNRLKFGQVQFSQFRENIKSFLGQQQLEERLKAWFEIIKKKYKVKNYTTEVS